MYGILTEAEVNEPFLRDYAYNLKDPLSRVNDFARISFCTRNIPEFDIIREIETSTRKSSENNWNISKNAFDAIHLLKSDISVKYLTSDKANATVILDK